MSDRGLYRGMDRVDTCIVGKKLTNTDMTGSVLCRGIGRVEICIIGRPDEQ